MAAGASQKDLIKTLNSLQDTFAAIGGETVDLPQIVVVGSQSAGKSSVLETIVGRDFLPRGQGIVTRRPLVLQLVHTPAPLSSAPSAHTNDANANPNFTVPSSASASSSSEAPQEYGEFLHVDKRFYDFGEIRKEIENETLRVAGGNKGISRLPIHLKIFSPNVLNLTLVDLPGLTKIPVGDQPTDIERQIRNLVLDFVSKPNCVILAISPANVDLANSESLKLARAVDPQGRRTIGVLTKLDLMDAGTHAADILTGRVYPLKLGFIGVVGRSQQDINAQKPMDEQLRSEEDFFRTHPGYRNIAHRCGTKFLAKTLNQVLMNHIRDKLPDMKARLNTLMGQTQQELNAFGDSAFLGEGHRGTLILQLMTQFVRDFVASIDGTSLEISTKELCGGARIYYIFNDVFGHALESINPTQNLTTQDIRTAIRNSTGPRPSLFVPEVAFDLLVKPQIKLLEPPSLRCVELVYEELMKICHNCTSTRYPRLHAQLIEVVSELLRERLGPTSEYVQSLISIQAAYINTNHPDFVKGSAAAAQESARVQRERRVLAADAAGGGAGGPGGPGGARGGAGGNKDGRRRSGAVTEAEDGDDFSGPDDDDERGPAALGHGHGHGGGASSASASGYLVPNGVNGASPAASSSAGKSRAQSAAGHHHARPSFSASQQPPTPTRGQHGASPILPPLGGPGGAGAHHDRHASSAKESFLTYFFGGNPVGAVGGLAGGGAGDMAHAGTGAGMGRGGELGQANPLSGRKGLEGNAAAFEMKSLDKHLEPSPLSSTGEPQLTDREELETGLIRALIASYFNIVRLTIQDLVPKAIMRASPAPHLLSRYLDAPLTEGGTSPGADLLVNFSRESVQNRLVASLYKDSLFDELLHEDEALTAERTRIQNLLRAYREAFQTLSEVL
ncbi:Dynamin central region-domain-containing protein [Rhodotorula diobovata]|uniref:dynamin GTPase n=1 Tax=Rhodotorula diobovata TaxID=5288 RepID=A0A5C5FNL8_9BASI|nr:Dynamin central region-domain-containing protein [Rhodotorula diobovata]